MAGGYRPRTQLYLAIDVPAAAEQRDRLTTLLAEVAVPSVLLNVADTAPTGGDHLMKFVAAIQARGTAVVINEDVSLASSTGADGVHLALEDDARLKLEPEAGLVAKYKEARAVLGDEAIIGIDAKGSRHAAMALAELGVGYVSFGLPSSDGLDEETDVEPQIDLVAWWAEIFEVPVVALDVVSEVDAREMTEAGADFVMRKVPVAQSTADLRDWVIAARSALERSETEGETPA